MSQARLRTRHLASAFRAWTDWSGRRCEHRARLLPALARLRNRDLAAAHTSWREAALARKGKRLLASKVLLACSRVFCGGHLGKQACHSSSQHRKRMPPFTACLPLQALCCLTNATLRRALNGWLSSHALKTHKRELVSGAVVKLQSRQLATVRATGHDPRLRPWLQSACDFGSGTIACI